MNPFNFIKIDIIGIFYFEIKMNSIIKESVNKVYHKFNQFKKKGFGKLRNLFKKRNSSETECNESISLEYDHDSLEYDHDSLEYYSDISDDGYNSTKCNTPISKSFLE